MRTITVGAIRELSTVAEQLLTDRPKGAVVGLVGNLGAGKTTFVKEFVRHLSEKRGAVAPRVTSPSYVIHQTYVIEAAPAHPHQIDHFDLYRLDSVDDQALIELGYFDVLARRRAQNGYVFVEWPERAQNPKLLEIDYRLTIQLEHGHRRLFSLEADPA